MDVVVTGVVWLLLLAGSFFLVTGSLGMVRLPDVFTRMHAAGMTDTMGAGLILAGLTVYAASGAEFLVGFRLLLVLAFLWFTSPIATHAVAKAALAGGIRPYTLAGGADPEGGAGANGSVADGQSGVGSAPDEKKGGSPS